MPAVVLDRDVPQRQGDEFYRHLDRVADMLDEVRNEAEIVLLASVVAS